MSNRPYRNKRGQWYHPMTGATTQQIVANPVATTDNPGTERTRGVDKIALPARDLPPHLFIPPGAQALDIRRAANIAGNTTDPFLFMSFTCPQGVYTHFLSYGIFSDGTLAANQEFIPRKNGARVFNYQGDPNDNFKINLGLAPDLSNSSLITTQLTLSPGETIEWFVRNLNVVNVAMGVRMVGYVDSSQKRVAPRTGA